MLTTPLGVTDVDRAALPVVALRVRCALGVAVGDGIEDATDIGITGVDGAFVLIITNLRCARTRAPVARLRRAGVPIIAVSVVGA